MKTSEMLIPAGMQKKFSVDDFEAGRLSSIVTMDETHFLIPCYGRVRSRSLPNAQLTFKVPRLLPNGMFGAQDRLGENFLWRLGFGFHNFPYEEVGIIDAIDYNGSAFFGDFLPESSIGRVFELKLPTEAHHVLYHLKDLDDVDDAPRIIDRFRAGSDYFVCTDGQTESCLDCYLITTVDYYIDENYRIVEMRQALTKLRSWIQNQLFREYLISQGAGDYKEARKRAREMRIRKESELESKRFLPELRQLERKIKEAERLGVPRYGLPKLTLESNCFSYTIMPLDSGEREENWRLYYNDRNVSRAIRRIEDNLEDLTETYERIVSAVDMVKMRLKTELEILNKYHIDIYAPTQAFQNIFLGRFTGSGCDALKTVSLFWSNEDTYDNELANTSTRDMASWIVDELKPTVDEKLQAIETITSVQNAGVADSKIDIESVLFS